VLALSRAGALGVNGVGEYRIGAHSAAYKITRSPSPSIALAFVMVDGTTARRVRQTIPLTTTRPPFGGKRWWFRCPSCGKAVIKMYMTAGREHLACRWCQGLTYRSVQMHDDRVNRLRRDLRRVAGILGGDVVVGETEYVLAMKACAGGPLAFENSR
jgi:hypothetical protein